MGELLRKSGKRRGQKASHLKDEAPIETDEIWRVVGQLAKGEEGGSGDAW